MEAPAGLIGIKAKCENGKVTEVTFKNVPAFAVYTDTEITVPHIGHGVEKVKVDVAWGGMFYAMADVRQFPWIELTPDMGREITRVSSLILKAAQDQLPVEHPNYPGVGIPTIRRQTSEMPLPLPAEPLILTIHPLGLVRWTGVHAEPAHVPEWLPCMQRVS